MLGLEYKEVVGDLNKVREKDFILGHSLVWKAGRLSVKLSVEDTNVADDDVTVADFFEPGYAGWALDVDWWANNKAVCYLKKSDQSKA